MVDVRFHHEFVAQVFPEVEVHSVVVHLAHWRFGRGDDVTNVTGDWPVWARGDGVCAMSERPGK